MLRHTQGLCLFLSLDTPKGWIPWKQGGFGAQLRPWTGQVPSSRLQGAPAELPRFVILWHPRSQQGARSSVPELSRTWALGRALELRARPGAGTGITSQTCWYFCSQILAAGHGASALEMLRLCYQHLMAWHHLLQPEMPCWAPQGFSRGAINYSCWPWMFISVPALREFCLYERD